MSGYLFVAEAMAALTVARLATMLPFRWVMKGEAPLDDAMLDIAQAPDDARVFVVAKLLGRARGRLPWKSPCLVTALAARAMLRRRGIPSILRFGLKRGEDGRIGAHAWLEAGNGVVCGGPAAEGFVHLAGFSRKPAP